MRLIPKDPRKKAYFGLALIALIFAIYAGYSYIDQSTAVTNIKLHSKITSAQIVDFRSSGKAGSGIRLFYCYVVGGDSLNDYRYSPFIKNQELIGKYFPVIFDSLNPSNNQMLLLKEEFDFYNLQFPDSLLWSSEYIR